MDKLSFKQKLGLWWKKRTQTQEQHLLWLMCIWLVGICTISLPMIFISMPFNDCGIVKLLGCCLLSTPLKVKFSCFSILMSLCCIGLLVKTCLDFEEYGLISLLVWNFFVTMRFLKVFDLSLSKL